MDDELIGRDQERAQLQAWANAALAGRGSLILIAGEAGVGKTTLVRQVLANSELQVLTGFGVQGGTTPFGPIVEALRSYLRTAGGEPLLEGPLAAHLALLLPELGPPAPADDRATLFEAIRQTLAVIAARRPAALFLDDLQWSDDATAELLGAWREMGGRTTITSDCHDAAKLDCAFDRAAELLRRTGYRTVLRLGTGGDLWQEENL